MIPRLCLRLGTPILLSVFFAASAAARHSLEEPAARSFDGTYQVQITTTDGSGACAPSYAGTVTIRNFRVVALSDPGAMASGGIVGDGTVSLAIRKNDQIANIGGRIKGRRASGTWSSPTAYCGGLWHAEREN